MALVRAALPLASLLALIPTGAVAQSLVGRVIAAEDSRVVAGATVTVSAPGRGTSSALTDEDGRFRIALPDAGRYLVGASSLGFRPVDSLVVQLHESREQVEVVIRLAVEPIGIEGLTVVARGMDARHLATLEGFRVRHETALDVGSVRLFDRTDSEFTSSFDLDDLRQWVNWPREKCVVFYVDGRADPYWGNEPTVPLAGLEGVEFYYNVGDAPLELRGPARPCNRSLDFSVVAVWRR